VAGNPTLYDVAREAGVSLATASRTLNGSTRVVKDEYRERVLAAAQRLGYTPNLSAQAVARGDSSTVALLVSDIADPYFAGIAAGVIRASDAAGLAVAMAVTERDTKRELDLIRMLRGQRPRVIVLAGSRTVDESSRETLVAELSAFEATGGRVVLVGQHGLPFPTVQIDNAGGAHELAASLAELGYREPIILAGPEQLVIAQERLRAFAERMPAARVIHGAFTRDGAHEAMLTAIDEGLGGADLVFAVNDVMAIGALSALRDRGLVGAVGVAGFDDIPMAQDVTPALTTVRVDLEGAGEASLALALGDSSSATIAATVVIRDSTPAR
jgi:LacI family transcriptional regulator